MSVVQGSPSETSFPLIDPRPTTEKRSALHIQQVCPSFGRACGVANFASNLAAALVREGTSVTTTTSLGAAERGNLLIQHEFALYDTGVLKESLRPHVGRTILFPHSPGADLHFADFVDGFATMSDGMTTSGKPTIVLPHPGWQQLPLLDRARLKAEFGWSDYRCVIGTNGFISPSRQFDRVLERFLEFAAGQNVLVDVNCPRHHSHNDRPGYRDQEQRLLQLARSFPDNLLLNFEFASQESLNRRFQASDLLWCWTASESKPYGSGTCSDQYGSGTRVIVAEKRQHGQLFSLPNVVIAPAELDAFVETMKAEVLRCQFDRHDPTPLSWTRFAQRFTAFVNSLPPRERPLSAASSVPIARPASSPLAVSAAPRQAPAKRTPEKLTPANAADRAARYLKSVRGFAGQGTGRGIVICAGGIDAFAPSWVLIELLRALACRLPIEWWCYAGQMDKTWAELIGKLGVAARSLRDRGPRSNSKWHAVHLKTSALLKSSFREVLLLEPGTIPLVDPTYLFSAAGFRAAGALFWSGEEALQLAPGYRQVFGVPARLKLDLEMERLLVDKSRGWKALHLSSWYGRHAQFFERYLPSGHGLFQLGWQQARASYVVAGQAAPAAGDVSLCCDEATTPVFQRYRLPYGLAAAGDWPASLAHAQSCRSFLASLESQWRPLDYRMRHADDVDRQLAATLKNRTFERSDRGGGVSAVQLGADGLVLTGRAARPGYWWVERRQLVLAGPTGQIQCRLDRQHANHWLANVASRRSPALRLTLKS